MNSLRKVVNLLKKEGLTISTMESCTGGGLVDAITSIEGASEVLKYSAVTYSNEYKIKMGVSPDVINSYTVYSLETAENMAYNISKFSYSDIGIGITGKLNRADINNNYGKDNEVFISIYFNNVYHDITVIVDKKTRRQNKKAIIDIIASKLYELLST